MYLFVDIFVGDVFLVYGDGNMVGMLVSFEGSKVDILVIVLWSFFGKEGVKLVEII